MGRAISSHIWVGMSNWASRLIAMVVQLVSIPLLLQSLGTEQYAAYSIAIATMAWFALADLGMSAAMQNFAVEARVAGIASTRELTAAGVMVMGVLFIGIPLVLLAAPTIGPKLMSGSNVSVELATKTFSVAGVLFLLSGVGAVANRFLYGLGKGMMANVLTAMASLLSLLSLWLCTRLFDRDDLLVPALLAYGCPLALSSTFVLAKLIARDVDLRFRNLRSDISRLWKRSRGFLIANFFAVCALNADYFIMSQILGAHDIAIYSILSRVYGMIINLYSGMLIASGVYWLERRQNNDWSAIRYSLRSHIVIGMFAVAVVTIAGIFIRDYVMENFSDWSIINIPKSTMIIFGIYVLVRVWNDTFAIALQAMNDTRSLIIVMPIQAFVSIAAQIIFSRFFGVNGIVIGLMTSFVVTSVWLLPLRLRKLARSPV